jgi:hypothetical protein
VLLITLLVGREIAVAGARPGQRRRVTTRDGATIVLLVIFVALVINDMLGSG